MGKSSPQDASFGQGLELAGVFIKAIAVAAKKNGVTSDDIQKIFGNTDEVYKSVDALISKFRSKKLGELVLKLVFSEKPLVISSSSKGKLAINAKDVFKFGVDDLVDWAQAEECPSTPEIEVDVYEIIKEITFEQLFRGFNYDLDKIVMTRSQIVYFCKNYRGLLKKQGHATYFLSKKRNQYTVITVYDNDFLHFHYQPLNNLNIDNIKWNPRLVFPRI